MYNFGNLSLSESCIICKWFRHPSKIIASSSHTLSFKNFELYTEINMKCPKKYVKNDFV